MPWKFVKRPRNLAAVLKLMKNIMVLCLQQRPSFSPNKQTVANWLENVTFAFEPQTWFMWATHICAKLFYLPRQNWTDSVVCIPPGVWHRWGNPYKTIQKYLTLTMKTILLIQETLPLSLISFFSISRSTWSSSHLSLYCSNSCCNVSHWNVHSIFHVTNLNYVNKTQIPVIAT